MKKNLLRTFLLLVISMFTYQAQAVTGIYLTYDDFKNGKLIQADPKSFVATTGIVKMEVNGQKIKYKIEDVWGFLAGGALFRVLNYAGGYAPAKMVSGGELCWWFIVSSVNEGVAYYSITAYSLTYGLNGKGYTMWKEKTLVEAAETQKEFKPIISCAAGEKGLTYVEKIYHCLEQQKDFTEDIGTLVPVYGNSVEKKKEGTGH